MKRNKIPGIAGKPNIGHDETLRYETEDGIVAWKVHPEGSRKLRRHKQRHHPFFTKIRTRGREWRRF